jgi:hypothetical protein
MNPMHRMLAACCLGLCLSAAGNRVLAQAWVNTSPVDTNAIHDTYLDGDFERATAQLERALNEKALRSHSDSVFAFKHLGVMNAANPETREKGKYYMVQLLNLEPSIKILDMYASDMIYMIFKNIQDEFDATRMRLDRAEKNWKGSQDAQPVSKTPPPKDDSKPSESHTLAWVGAGTAVVAAGVAAYFMFSDSPETTKLDSDFGK